MQINLYNYSTLFVYNPRTQNQWLVDNGTGADVTYQLGTVFGRIDATGKLWPMDSTATDGSQKPIGVLAATTVVPASSTNNPITLVIQGDVVAGWLIFINGTDTLATTIAYDTSGDIIGTINDILTGRGLLPIVSTEGTFYDNH